MLHALLSCGAGMSSSALTAQCNRSLVKYGLGEEMDVEFKSIHLIKEEDADKFDIVICCPHLVHQVKDLNEKKIHNKIPIYVLPPQMYGAIDGKDIYEDCVDVIEQFKATGQNPFSFPGEETIMKVKRRHSRRSGK